MSHKNQLQFIEKISNLLSNKYDNSKVMEIGAHSVNGEIRDLFNFAGQYTGVDLCNGPGVDIVSSGHLIGSTAEYDITLACEVFEHNPLWIETFINMIRITKPGGIILLTCGSRGRLEHGTTRTDPTQSPGTSSIGWNYYKNLNEADFTSKIDFKNHFSEYQFHYIAESEDLYFIGEVKDISETQKPRNCWLRENGSTIQKIVEEIDKTKNNSTLSRIRLMPLKLLSIILSDKAYQTIAIPYIKHSINLSLKLKSIMKK